jgi:hypothetical protein
MMIDHYSSFDGDGRAVSCDLISGVIGRSSSSERDDGGSEENGSIISQDGLIAHMGGLNGLGGSANCDGMHSTSSSNSWTSITLLPPASFNNKIERPGSSFSSHEEYQTSSSNMEVPFSVHPDLSEDSFSKGPSLNGPFAYGNSTKSIRKQHSVPASLSGHAERQNEHHQQQQQQQQQQYSQIQETPELTFADLKTPTAFHFKQNNQQNMGKIHASGTSSTSSPSSNSSGTPNDNYTRANRFGLPMLGDYTSSSSQHSQSPNGFTSIPSGSAQAEQERSQLSAFLGRAASPMARSASIPSAPTTAETFAQRFKGRRATLPDLQIKIPPLPKNNPPSASSNSSICGSVGQGKSTEAIKEVGEEDIGEHEEEEDEVHGGKKTARLIPSSYPTQSTNMPAMLDLPLPSFDDIIQSFSSKLVGSPNYPSISSTGQPSYSAASHLSNARKVDFTMSADAVIQARNRSVALLKDLDMGHAEAIWDLYRTSHCRGLLRLAQQGELEEVSLLPHRRIF